MKLEQQVCSLELAKRLKELGVTQESHFAFDISTDPPRIQCTQGGLGKLEVSAFAVAELGEMLPAWIDAEGEAKTLTTDKSSSGWGVHFVGSRGDYYAGINEQPAITEADARAKMVIYLIENNIFTLK